MLTYLYKNWAYICLPMAVCSVLILLSSIHQLPLVEILIWLQFSVYLLHQFEEHAYPGGFKNFVNKEIFKVKDKDVPMDKVNIFWINILDVWLLFPLVAILAQNVDISVGAILAYFGMFNASLHILFFILSRKYNPGFLVSVFLNYPTGIYTLLVMHHLHLLTWLTHLYALAITLILHLVMVLYASQRYKKYQQGLITERLIS